MPKIKPTIKIGWLVAGWGLPVVVMVGILVAQPTTQANNRLQVNSSNQTPTDESLKLNVNQRQIIRGQCLTIQVNQALRARTALNQVSRPRYERSVDEIINHLRNSQLGLAKMGEDSSEIDLALVYLIRHRDRLREAFADYDLALTRLTVIDCKQNPVGFVADLRQVQASRRTVADESRKLANFIDNEINQALFKTRQQLLEIKLNG